MTRGREVRAVEKHRREDDHNHMTQVMSEGRLLTQRWSFSATSACSSCPWGYEYANFIENRGLVIATGHDSSVRHCNHSHFTERKLEA